MVNKKIWLGMLVMVLAFGMTVIGCDNGSGDGGDGKTTISIKNSSTKDITHIKVEDSGGEVVYDEDITIAPNTTETITVTLLHEANGNYASVALEPFGLAGGQDRDKDNTILFEYDGSQLKCLDIIADNNN